MSCITDLVFNLIVLSLFIYLVNVDHDHILEWHSQIMIVNVIELISNTFTFVLSLLITKELKQRTDDRIRLSA